MTSNSMSSIARKFSSIPCYHLGSNRISRSNHNSDYNSIAVGLSLWYGVILDYNSMFCFAEKAMSNQGRILKHAIAGWPENEEVLMDLLKALDELSDVLLKNISSSTGFKAQSLLTELKTWLVPSWLAPLKGILLDIFRSGFARVGDEGEVRVIRAIRQVSCFLKKLDVSRPDLEDQMKKEFLDFEEFLSTDIPVRSKEEAYLRDVSEMKHLLAQHLDEFHMDPFVPGHGPGAVSNPLVKCWFDKHSSASLDGRIGYLLGHADLGSQSDYLPLVNGSSSTRTSRYISVPKTWKKLRGISAEPSELQFWQQGVLRRIDSMFLHDKWWRDRINLHSQARSRELALYGSKTGNYATVDLSAASDSVTLQLVRDLFGNTHLGRWLLGTRSVFTLCGEQTIRIHKFAPMGSACCFPVECMIFCLAAEVAVRRTRKPSCYARQVCVFGDDIIVPSYAVHELMEILSHLGFSVNTEKSFWEGDFREACGIEAWRGQDIAPCRFRSWSDGILGRCSDYDEIASMVSFANELFVRGLHDTREFLLDLLFDKKIKLGGGQEFRVQSTIFSSFSGESQTLASPFPTNFNLVKKFSRPLQTYVYKRVVWQERPRTRNLGSEMSESYDMCEYVTWLIRHQPGVQDFDALWSDGWIESVSANPYSRLPLGTTMVPTVKWALPPTYFSIG